MQFKDKTILITGASDGIGKATALLCAQQGATVIIHGKTQAKLEVLYDEIIAAGLPEPIIYVLDFEKITPDDCTTLYQSIKKEFGTLDALFINAAWLGNSAPVQQYDIAIWHRVMQVNLNANFMLVQACLPLLNHPAGSSLVFNLDDKSYAYWGAYGSSKAGLKAFMQIIADELENSPINVKALVPDKVQTALRAQAFPAEDPTHLCPASTVAKAAAILLSSKSNEIHQRSTHGRMFSVEKIISLLN